MATSNVGKVVLLPKGNWSASATYNFLDFVLHNGSSWVSKTNGNIGHEPSISDTTNWQVLATAAEEVTVESQTLAYASQSSSSFTGNPPTSGWQSTVPAVSAGDYLWVRTTTEFSDGNSFNSYNVTRYGTNGTGVGTVTGAKLGTSGTLIEPTDGVLAFPVDATPTDSSTNLVLSGGIAQRIYQVVSQMVTKLTSGTTKKVYIHEGSTQSDMELSDIGTSFTVSLTAEGWSSKAQTIFNAKFIATGFAYVISPAPSSFSAYGEAQIYADNVTTDGQITFHCENVPSGTITVNIFRSVAV